MMKCTSFSDLTVCLRGDQPPRVWSLLVTVFGELAQDEGARISGALLNHLCSLMGLKPEATRVALHRLRKDGWITSARQGRTSTYALTEWGRAQSHAATPHIYATAALADRAWLIVHEPGHVMIEAEQHSKWITPNLSLTSQSPRDGTTFAAPVLSGTMVPEWMANALCDEPTNALARTLILALEEIGAHPALLNGLDPRQIAALRVLIVHDWRRIILKTPILPDFVFPKDWPGARCRQQVAHVLSLCPPQHLSQLEPWPS